MPSPASAPSSRATHLRLAFLVLLVEGIAFALTEYGRPQALKSPLQLLWESGAFFPLQLGALLALEFAARRADLPAQTRRGLRVISWGFGAVALGTVVTFTMALRGTPLPYVSWADGIYFAFYPCLILGVRALPVVDRPTDRVRDMLGWVVVLLAFGGLIAFTATIEARSGIVGMARRVAMIVNSSAQLVTLMAINSAVERGSRVPSSRAMNLLLGALALSVLGDLVFQVLDAAGYDGVNLATGAAIATNLLVFRAAIHFVEDPIPAADASVSPRSPFSPLPIIAVSALVLMVVWMAGSQTIANTGTMMAGLVALNAMLVVRDVRASRAAAAAVQAIAQREAARRLDALVRHASDAIILLDLDGRLVFASAPADELFGAVLSTMEGLPIEMRVPESERGSWRAFISGLRETPGHPATHTWQLLRPSGEARMVETVGTDLRNEPAVRGIVLSSRDVTERATLEERLRHAQKLDIVGRLAGGVAHDFNNVLAAVIAGTELAQLSLEADHPVQEDLSGIGAAAQRGAALTRRLLAFVRQEPVPAQRFDLREMLTELEPLLRRLSGEANPVVLSIAPDVSVVNVDCTELEHILFNLVANARDAMREGGPIEIMADVVTVDDHAVAGEVVIAPPAGRHARLAVIDRGHGMTEEVRRRMFDPFFTQKSGARGTGLGLIGVRPLVDGAKGGLTVDSSPNAGTRITLYLPVEPATAERPVRRSTPARTPAIPRISPRAGRSSLGRILLVEDEPAVREQLARLLDSIGYDSIAVASGAQARSVLSSGESVVDAVVSDVMMPGETGLEFTAWLRERHARMPILLISGHTGTALDREARMVTELPLLRKPFTGAELADSLDALLERARAGSA